MNHGILQNDVLLCGSISWIVAQVLKTLLYSIREKDFSWERMHGAGGMPSSHSATVTSVAFAIGLIDGFDSSVFALAFFLAIIVMHDASGVRRSVGIQAEILNDYFEEQEHPVTRPLKELIGHKPLEVAAGALIGLMIVGIYFGVFNV